MLRNRIVYGLLLVGSSLLVYYFPNLITSIFFHTTVFILLLSLAHLIYSYAVIRISQNLEPNIVEHGQTAQYSCNISNEGSLPTAAVTVNFLFDSTMFKDQLKSKTFTLSNNKNRVFDYDLSCKYRGVYQVGLKSVDLVDMLNVFKFKVHNIESRNITVLPKITQLPNFYIPPKAESDKKAVSAISAEGANSLVDVRKFAQGDALKHIHWKLSARHDELLVRNLERSAQNSTLVFLDTSKGRYDFENNLIVEDKLMEALVSVVSQCIMQNHILEINYNTFNPVHTVCSTRDDFHAFYTEISKITFMHKTSIKSAIDNYFMHTSYRQNLWNRDIFIFTCHPSLLENQSIINKLISTNCNINIVSCSFSKEKEGAYKTVDGINHYSLSPSSDLKSIFLGRRN